jgi:hypothetical protein
MLTPAIRQRQAHGPEPLAHLLARKAPVNSVSDRGRVNEQNDPAARYSKGLVGPELSKSLVEGNIVPFLSFEHLEKCMFNGDFANRGIRINGIHSLVRQVFFVWMA